MECGVLENSERGVGGGRGREEVVNGGTREEWGTDMDAGERERDACETTQPLGKGDRCGRGDHRGRQEERGHGARVEDGELRGIDLI